MSDHDGSDRSRKNLDAIRGNARFPREVRELYESEFRKLLASDPILWKKVRDLSVQGVWDFLIGRMVLRASDDIENGVNLNVERGSWLKRIASETIWLVERDLEIRSNWDSSFRILFASNLTEDQFRGALRAVADYYRACGGAGLKVEFDTIEAPASKFGAI